MQFTKIHGEYIGGSHANFEAGTSQANSKWFCQRSCLFAMHTIEIALNVLSRESLSSVIFDQFGSKPACSAIEASSCS